MCEWVCTGTLHDWVCVRVFVSVCMSYVPQYELFMRYFLTDNVTRTENPYEAQLFYVPALLYFYIGGSVPCTCACHAAAAA